MRKALRYFPHEYDDIKDLNDIWKRRHYQPEETFQRLCELAHHCVVWDDAGKELPESSGHESFIEMGGYSEGLIRIERNGKVGFTDTNGANSY